MVKAPTDTNSADVAAGAETAPTKTLVVGDLHLRQEVIYRIVDTAVEQLGVGRVVFTGDYTDNWYASAVTFRDAFDEMLIWVKRRRREGLAVDLVLGNHDSQYLLGEPGPGSHMDLAPIVVDALDQLGVTAATTVGASLVTHAGVTAMWAKRFLSVELLAGGGVPSAGEIARELNAMLECGRAGDEAALRTLASAGSGRGGAGIPGPLWADQSELYQDPVPGLDQIVGHTPVESIDLWSIPAEDGVRTSCHLIFCDTFSLTRDLSSVGDGSMLLVDGKTVRTVTPESLGMDSWGAMSWDWMMACVMPFLGR